MNTKREYIQQMIQRLEQERGSDSPSVIMLKQQLEELNQESPNQRVITGQIPRDVSLPTSLQEKIFEKGLEMIDNTGPSPEATTPQTDSNDDGPQVN